MEKNKYIPPCKKCGGKCCNYVALEINKPGTKTDIDYIRWYLLHKDINVFVDHWNKWHVEFKAKCDSLTSDKMCSIYDSRPKLCRNHGIEEDDCEYYESPFKQYFTTVAEFEKYLKKKGIDWKFKRF